MFYKKNPKEEAKNISLFSKNPYYWNGKHELVAFEEHTETFNISKSNGNSPGA